MVESSNYFLLLELDPDKEPDEKAIDAAIAAKQQEWSSDQNRPEPDVKRNAQKNLQNLKPKRIKELLLNPETRKTESLKAKEEIRQFRDSKRADFESAVEVLCKGARTEQAIRRIVNKFKDHYYTESDVRELIKRIDAREASADTDVGAGAEKLDPSTANSIDKNLKIIKKNDLYEFLGFSSDARSNIPLDSLRKQAEKMDSEIRGKSAITPEDSARSELAGHCLSLFKDDSGRRRYDRARAEQQLEPLWDLINVVCDSGSLEIGQLLEVLRKGEDLNVGRREVIGAVKKRAKKRNARFVIDPSLDFEQAVQCVCSHANSPLAEKCEKCGALLYYKCPNCGLATRASSTTCFCGFSVQRVVDKLEFAYRREELESFLAVWDEVRDKNHPAFHKWINQIPSIRVKIEKGKQAEKILLETIEQLGKAVESGDTAAILATWNESLLTVKPDIKKRLPDIRKAHEPSDVSGVEAVHHGSYIQVRWELREYVSQYIVAWSQKSYPPSHLSGERVRMTRGEYALRGCRIENLLGSNYYIKVFAVTKFMGEELISPGTAPGCCAPEIHREKTRIRYSIKFVGLGRKRRAVLTLISSSDASSVPQLLLVARRGSVAPTDAQGGIVLSQLSGITLRANTPFEWQVSLEGISSPARFRLFVDGQNAVENVELVPLELTKMKL